MLKLTTKSGAVYLLDTEKPRLRRQGPHSPGINYSLVPDDEWHALRSFAEPVVGKPAVFGLAAGMFRVTTPVVSIEELTALAGAE